MAQTKCVLDILKQNNFIKIKLTNEDFSLNIWELKLENITNSDTRREVIKKILKKMESDDEYIVGTKWDTRFRFTTKKEIDKMINNFLETGEERLYVKMDCHGLAEWIDKHYNHSVIAHHGCYSNIYNYDLINLEVRRKRREKEISNNQKVLELLNDIL